MRRRIPTDTTTLIQLCNKPQFALKGFKWSNFHIQKTFPTHLHYKVETLTIALLFGLSQNVDGIWNTSMVLSKFKSFKSLNNLNLQFILNFRHTGNSHNTWLNHPIHILTNSSTYCYHIRFWYRTVTMCFLTISGLEAAKNHCSIPNAFQRTFRCDYCNSFFTGLYCLYDFSTKKTYIQHWNQIFLLFLKRN